MIILKYQRPVCVCGNELVYFESKNVEEIFQITKNGFQYKNTHSTHQGHSEVQGLACSECEINFDADYDIKGRIVKGEEI